MGGEIRMRTLRLFVLACLFALVGFGLIMTTNDSSGMPTAPALSLSLHTHSKLENETGTDGRSADSPRRSATEAERLAGDTAPLAPRDPQSRGPAEVRSLTNATDARSTGLFRMGDNTRMRPLVRFVTCEVELFREAHRVLWSWMRPRFCDTCQTFDIYLHANPYSCGKRSNLPTNYFRQSLLGGSGASKIIKDMPIMERALTGPSYVNSVAWVRKVFSSKIAFCSMSARLGIGAGCYACPCKTLSYEKHLKGRRWLWKPEGGSSGHGIALITNAAALAAVSNELGSVLEFLEDPLVIVNPDTGLHNKVDVRMYGFTSGARDAPHTWVHTGAIYYRTSLNFMEYNRNDPNIAAHITNSGPAFQKKQFIAPSAHDYASSFSTWGTLRKLVAILGPEREYIVANLTQEACRLHARGFSSIVRQTTDGPSREDVVNFSGFFTDMYVSSKGKVLLLDPHIGVPFKPMRPESPSHRQALDYDPDLYQQAFRSSWGSILAPLSRFAADGRLWAEADVLASECVANVASCSSVPQPHLTRLISDGAVAIYFGYQWCGDPDRYFDCVRECDVLAMWDHLSDRIRWLM